MKKCMFVAKKWACRFANTAIDSSNTGCIGMLCLSARHLNPIASVDSAEK